MSNVAVLGVRAPVQVGKLAEKLISQALKPKTEVP